MTESEAREFLANNGPWSVSFHAGLNTFTFENTNGDVVTLDLWTEPGYPDCSWDVVYDFTKGVRL